LQKVREAWQRRQDATTTFVFEFSELCALRPDRLLTDGDIQFRIIIRREQKFAMDGERLSYRLDSNLRTSRQEYEQVSGRHETYNGETSQRYSGTTNPASVGLARITSDVHAFAVNEISLRPLILIYRPFYPTVGKIDFANYRTADSQEMINGISCIVVRPSDNAAIQHSYWVDPDRDFLPLQYANHVNGKLRYRIVIDYRETEQGWVPSMWKLNRFNTADKLIAFTKTSVTAFALNENIDPAEFNIQPLPGAPTVRD
jgi:hypothetical protein